MTTERPVRGLPRIAATTAPASLPPILPGLDPAWSRLVTVPTVETAGVPLGRTGGTATVPRTWHLLDTAGSLGAAGIDPVGTILCVHGNPTWSYLWRSVLTASLEAARAGAPAWRVVAVDQLDMGYSERTGAPRTLPDRVRDLGAVTDELGLTGPSAAARASGPVVTLGHDWGGVVSMGWAVDHPDVLAAVMLCNTAIHQPADSSIPAPLRLALRPGVLGRATVLTPAFLDTTLAIAHPALTTEVRDAYRAPYRGAARRGGVGGFVADIPVDAQHPSRSELDRIAEGVRRLDVPTLMLWGPRDPIFSDRYLDDLRERMPHADVHRFEGAGHMLPDDVDVAGNVMTWLGDRFGAAGTSGPTAAEPVASEPVAPEPVAPEPVAPEPSRPFRPVWAALDDLADSDDTALIEMAPPGVARHRRPATTSPSTTVSRPDSGARSLLAPRAVSWRLLTRRVRELAVGFADLGMREGDRVSLLVTPGADLTAVLYACLRIGAVGVVADAGLGLRGLTRAVRGARPDWIVGALPGLTASRSLGWPGRRISTTRLAAPAAAALGVEQSLAEVAARGADLRAHGTALPEPPAADAVAAVLFTSGSTGPAKGVVYTHAQLAAVRDVLAARYDVGVGTGLVAGFAPFALLGPALGARSVTPDMEVTSPRTLTASALAAAVDRADGTVVFLSPAALANVVATSATLTDADHRALAGVRVFLSAGAPVPEPLLTEAARLMPAASAHTPYGMTEGLLLTDIDLPGIRAAARTGQDGVCVGRAAAGVTLLISALDDLGAAVGVPDDTPGVTGEVVVSAPHVKDHYDALWRTDREASRGTGTDSDGRRWHRTGDVGHLDAEGRLWIEGRLPHVVTTEHGVVTPVGPEQRAERVRQVGRAAIVGVGPRGDQQLVAVVETVVPVRRAGLADAALTGAVRRAVTDATTSVTLAAVLAVPRLPTDVRHNSKIDRTRLADWASRMLSGARMTRP
ncbi:alpha/beta fold hydrolase [Curtobacterium sp. RRHDQ10]|uniref:alpha/beta fold hydrolase n=1 Tax=Curtobacterium phyllosphaerae TaxID=3413379 RepID=UPI003BF2F73E